MQLSLMVRRLLLAFGACMLLAASQCVVVAPPPGGGGYNPPPPPRADYRNARYVRGIRCDRRVSRWRTRGFYDRRFRACYACPRGYRKSVFSVRSRRACVTGVARFFRAQYLGRPGCRAGEFRYRGNCYRCPTGYGWTRRGIQCVRR